MANYSPMTKIMMDDSGNSKNYPKSKSPFHSSSWIHQAKDVKKENLQDEYKSDSKVIKPINDYEIKTVFKINMEGYYKNIPIYHENRNRHWRMNLKK
jgi:hypothetical protein